MNLQTLCLSEGRKLAVQDSLKILREKLGNEVKRVILFGSTVIGDFFRGE